MSSESLHTPDGLPEQNTAEVVAEKSELVENLENTGGLFPELLLKAFSPDQLNIIDSYILNNCSSPISSLNAIEDDAAEEIVNELKLFIGEDIKIYNMGNVDESVRVQHRQHGKKIVRMIEASLG